MKNKYLLGLSKVRFLLIIIVPLGLISLYSGPFSWNKVSISEASINKTKDSQANKIKFYSNQLLIKVKISATSKIKNNDLNNSNLSSLEKVNRNKKIIGLSKISTEDLNIDEEADLSRWYVVKFKGTEKIISEEVSPLLFPPIVTIAGKKVEGVMLNQDSDLLSLKEAKQKFEEDPDIEFVQYNYEYKAEIVPNDTRWADQWDMTKISAPLMWDTQTDASNTVVAVIDTGIDYNHPDLQDNLWSDTTGNHAFNCIGGACRPGGLDDHGHGTHVAGTIGASSNNQQGIAGINWKVKILALKFLDSTGNGSTIDAIAAFQKVASLKQSGVNIRVTNNSWSGGGYDQALKDAMTQVENLGIIDVAAAGNSAINTDLTPSYPASYDNRGIVSVLATNNTDLGASFSNFGISTVDIAAPGVSILSTSPSGTCTLCDPSGYKLLSGTSMASPHVAGALAALLSKYPNLNAIQARDALLNPSSYDLLNDAKAMWTSTGGRLNLYKLINNSFNQNPIKNNFPTITTPEAISALAGETVSFSPQYSDIDGDNLRQKSMFLPGDYYYKISLPQWILRDNFPMESSGNISFVAPNYSKTTLVQYLNSVTDNKGGSAESLLNVVINPGLEVFGAPSGFLSVSPTSGPVGGTFTVNFPVDIPTGGKTSWKLFIGYPTGVAYTYCCTSYPSINVTLPEAGAYRISAQAINSELQLSPRETTIVYVGEATGTPPITSVTLDKTIGSAPLTINFTDQSYNPDGNPVTTTISGTECYLQSGTGSCTLTKPGNYGFYATTRNKLNQLSDVAEYTVTVLPGQPVPPSHITLNPNQLNFASKINEAAPSAQVNLSNTSSSSLNWTAGTNQSWCHATPGSGNLLPGLNSNITIYLDKMTSAGTYNCNVHVTAPNTDNSPQYITVNYEVSSDTVPPIVSIVSPTNGSAVMGNVNISANASDNIGVTKVEFYVDNALLSTDYIAPYSGSWNSASSSIGSHVLTAKAYDATGNSTISSGVSVNILDSISPSVSITKPLDGSLVTRNSSVTISASATDNVAVQKVLFYANNILKCTDLASPYTCSWSVPAQKGAVYSIKATAYDSANNTKDATSIVTSK